MRWFRHTVSLVLVLAAAAIAISIGFSDHSDDYGRVALPQGGVVTLPEGKVTVFFDDGGQSADRIRRLTAPLTFRVVSAKGGEPVPVDTAGEGQSEIAVQRSETLGELGSVAKLDVPRSGTYVVSGRSGLPPGASSLSFGTNAGAALIERWRLFAALLGGALLISLIPLPRRGRWSDEDEAPGWSSDPTAPYAARAESRPPYSG